MSLRILCIGETWLGSDARAAFLAFRRLGHSVQIIDEWNYVPLTWRSFVARAIRKSMRSFFVRELARDAVRMIDRYKPHMVFVFKGNWVDPLVIQHCRDRVIPVVNYYPDVSFMVHGPRIPKALPLYDHVFTTKSYGLRDMQESLGVTHSSFLEPGFDPELHRPMLLSAEDQGMYGCDVAFIGTWSPKKEALLAAVQAAMPNAGVRIWGCQWDRARTREIVPWIMGDEVTGDEYTKALCGAKVCLGILSEQRTGASSGDLITARTFQIPACGAFMLHERNGEVLRYFTEDQEAGYFDGPEELVAKLKYFLANGEIRASIASGGLRRSMESDYSIDARMKQILHWLNQRKEQRT